MTTIKINERTKTGKAFMEMFEAFFKGLDGIEIVETDSYAQVNEEESIYSPEFIEKIKKAEDNIKKGKTRRLNPDDIWGSIL
ncbi:DUF2683 family protein [Flavobacterium notoginsengisoli]|uniref:DUF2683 family protein n=1 Tax=Flavobacterium notoginsengisoli TaxID=1478199 RepID=UPI00362A1E4E